VRDQATQLRQMDFSARQSVPESSVDGPETIVVASGKGGVGKSVVSVLLAHSLARSGRRVLLLEGDQNRGSLHLMLGVKPAERLDGLIAGHVSPIDLLTPVTDELWLLPAASGAEALYALGATDRARLHQRLHGLFERFDAVVIDAASDLEGIVRVSSMGATLVILLTVPQPAALIDTYAVMKTVTQRVPTLRMGILVNRASNGAEARSAFERLATAGSRFLKHTPEFLGSLPDDDLLGAVAQIPGGLIERTEQSVARQELDRVAADFLESPEVAVSVGGIS
jgi:flagellar biosynthesis protein FlhG